MKAAATGQVFEGLRVQELRGFNAYRLGHSSLNEPSSKKC